MRYNFLRIEGTLPGRTIENVMKPRPDLTLEESDGELIVLDKDGGKVHQLNLSAALIWRGLNDGMETGEIAALLASTFDIDQKTVISDVKATIAELRELGLLSD